MSVRSVNLSPMRAEPDPQDKQYENGGYVRESRSRMEISKKGLDFIWVLSENKLYKFDYKKIV